MAGKFQTILDGLWKAWGIQLHPAPVRTTSRRIGVYLPLPDGTRLAIGHLTLEEGEYTFRYAVGFRSSGFPTVPEFPELDRTYKSRLLWPFFADRIPPTDREDVRLVVEERQIDTTDCLGLLAALGRKTAVSPYILEPTPA